MDPNMAHRHKSDWGKPDRNGSDSGPPDLNYLFQREQVERVRADRAASAASARAHRELASLYGKLIDEARVGRGASTPADL